jgi:2-dehydro-3-deoxygalactonokinase
MSGEIFDRLTAKGLLASIVEGEATDGPAFLKGVAAGRARKLSLGTLLFGARAQVVRGFLSKPDAASYIRGLLIGSEIADAMAVYPTAGDAVVPLIGSRVVCALYASALNAAGIASAIVDSRIACLRGFRALHELRHG